MNKTLIALLATAALATASHAAEISVDDINNADPTKQSSLAATIKLQVLLDRAAASPTVIDGKMGTNTETALKAFARMHDLDADGKLDEKTWAKLTDDARDVAVVYELTAEDVNQKLIAETPDDYEKMSKLDCLCFHRVSEAIAEKFHMSEALLKQLNPNADFSKVGTKLLVSDGGGMKQTKVVRIEVNKSTQQVLGFDAEDKLVFFSPAVIGSEENPSPSGKLTVSAIAPNPTYTLNAKKNLGGDSDEKFIIAPGPNGPVGSMWIDLSKPTFGIHGTPYPEKISAMESHGCVRMTNWDANELGHIVEIGAEVEFTN